MLSDDVVIVGAVSDDPLASDIAERMGQELDISDILAFKDFANTEFCPRFIFLQDDEHVGKSLEGKTVVIVSSCSGELTRNARAMRNFLTTRAAKDNGAERVILVEPDLFYSAQDRGPRQDPNGKPRPFRDLKKFDGQPFSSRLYCELLKVAGVDDSFVKLDREQPEIVARINAAKPDMLFVALGNPKQELWMGRNAAKLDVGAMIGIGGTFNFIAGRVKRAPKWMQAGGLEWIYRIIQEPGRLWKRYAYGLVKFSWLSLRAVARGHLK